MCFFLITVKFLSVLSCFLMRRLCFLARRRRTSSQISNTSLSQALCFSVQFLFCVFCKIKFSDFVCNWFHIYFTVHIDLPIQDSKRLPVFLECLIMLIIKAMDFFKPYLGQTDVNVQLLTTHIVASTQTYVFLLSSFNELLVVTSRKCEILLIYVCRP